MVLQSRQNSLLYCTLLIIQQNQMGKEYYKEYFTITEPMFVKPREFKILKRMSLPFVAAKDANFK
jgi:hypothetical protein